MEDIQLNNENRIAELTLAFGEEGLAYLIENYGAPDRVTAIEFVQGRPVMIGDCPCAGSDHDEPLARVSRSVVPCDGDGDFGMSFMVSRVSAEWCSQCAGVTA